MLKNKVPIEAKGLTKRIAKDTKVSGISKSVSKVLKRWLYEHIDNPYPSHVEKQKLSDKTGLATKQIQNWFINARKRIWQPIIDEQKTNKAGGAKLMKLKLEVGSDDDCSEDSKGACSCKVSP